ncbi:hypothetical protein FE257_012669 [Aspergillus nanangensis]|uniref:Secretory lipase-domain-containing protein n=1 Tax=Aspergillus nanangensis TaxID=2582783 RepID=A0AAD4GQN9_ASPNN|nr:hypothetical protein FE257_012669 [Aspergillus nanangensis]
MSSVLVRVIGAVATLCLFLPGNNAHSIFKRQSPTLPTDDPFYTPSIGFQNEEPGTILRYRTMPYPLSKVGSQTANFKTGFQILYRTTDALGNAEATVTTLLVPHNASDDKLLSYQTGEDAVYLNCAPSYGLQQGAETSSSTPEIALISAALNQGWYVSVPDYEGPNSSVTANPQAAHATLDNIRAVLKSGSFSNLSSEARAVMWGYSGGSMASEYAAEYLSTYAPELNIVGAALGGLEPNVSASIEYVNSGPNSYLIPMALNGLAMGYPNMSQYIDQHLVSSTAATFRIPLTECLNSYQSTFSGQNIFDYFDNGMGLLTDLVPSSIYEISWLMGTRGTPKIPMYFYHGVEDEVSHIAETDALYAKYCAGGATIQYQRNLVSPHVLDGVLGAPAAISWMKDRLEGVALAPGCSVEDVVVTTLSLDDIVILGEIVYNYLNYVLGQM